MGEIKPLIADGLEQIGSQATCSYTKQLTTEPLLAQHLFYDGIILHGTIGGGYTARCFKTAFNARLLIVFL